MALTNGTTGVADERNAANAGAPEAAPRRGPFDLNGRQKLIVAGIVNVHVMLARLTLRDLGRRPAEAVRGPKWIWRFWASLNSAGSVAYWVFGRRRTVTTPPDT